MRASTVEGYVVISWNELTPEDLPKLPKEAQGVKKYPEYLQELGGRDSFEGLIREDETGELVWPAPKDWERLKTAYPEGVAIKTATLVQALQYLLMRD